MSETTISTVATEAGTVEGLKTEVREGLHPSEERACNKVMHQGIEVMSEGMHPRGDITPVVSIFLRPSWHPKVITAGQNLTDELYSLQKKSWRTKIGSGEIKIVPFLGESQIEHEKCIMQVIRINGSLYDKSEKLVDLREMEASETRAFLRSHTLPRWQVDPSQTKFPEFDELDCAPALAFGEMLTNMSTHVDDQLGNFLKMAAWLKKHGPSGKVFATGLGTSQGLKTTE